MSRRFRRIALADRGDIRAISEATWEGEDFLARVFESWVADPGAHFLGLEEDGRIVGCGRLLPFDRRRAWLEGLRVHPSAQGRGLGREVAHRIFRLGRELGFERLYFSTYFRNDASIRISTAAGFRRIAAFSRLELRVDDSDSDRDRPRAGGRRSEGSRPKGPSLDDPGPDSPRRDGHGPSLAVPPTASLGAFTGWKSNDWLFVPEDLAGAERFFPRPAVAAAGSLRMLLADNLKDAEACLGICGVDGPVEADPRPCLEAARAEARRRGQGRIHLMLPAARPVAPYHAFGFRSYEQTEDVLLFECRTAELRIEP